MAVKIDDAAWVPSGLRAKSVAKGSAESAAQSLQGHSMAVLEAARTLVELRGPQSLAALGLDAAAWHDSLQRVVTLAAAIHDLGKASVHFQRMVWNGKRDQLVRHEALLWWICKPEGALYRWLSKAVLHEWELVAALAAASGHHRKFTRDSVRTEGGLGSTVAVLVDHPDFAALLRAIGRSLRVEDAPPTLPRLDVHLTLGGGDHEQKLRWLSAKSHVDEHIDNNDKRTIVAIAKSLLISADIAGSALPHSGEKLSWLRTLLARKRDGSALSAVIEKKLSGRSLRPFQCRVRDQRASVTLVRAGCGTGKTLAAYAWAAMQHPQRSLWLTYPTTGTAAEGYRGYLNELVKAREIEARLESGRAAVDYEIFELYGEGDDARELDRLDALRIWGEDVVACTVDTVLGLLQNHRKGHYAWPSLSQSAIVFDEIHAYDEKLFKLLLRWLRSLPGVPALLMTASLPADRLAALERAVLARGAGALEIVDGPKDIETLQRYIIERADSTTIDTVVCDAMRAGKKVLWVSNTVDRCIESAERVSRVLESSPRGQLQSEPVLVYHSRFRYEDRVKRHQSTVSAFEDDRVGGVVACTTQVAEMSLDLSADLLVFDVAPVAAMIQRLGRLNRRAVPADPSEPQPPPMTALVLAFDGLPYTPEDLQRGRAWLEGLPSRALSQRDLIERWREQPATELSIGDSAWLDDPFATTPHDAREASPGISVLLDADAVEVRKRKSLAVRYAIPMNQPPTGADWRAWDRAGWLPVVPKVGVGSVEYSAERGARWRKARERIDVRRVGAMAKPRSPKPARPTSLIVDLDMPGITPLLASGVGGLAASLHAIARRTSIETRGGLNVDAIAVGPGQARIEPRRIVLEWPEGQDKAFFEALCEASFRIDADGIIELPGAWDASGAPPLEVRSMLQDALRYTFLQHGSAARRDGAPQLRTAPREDSERPLVVRVQRHSTFNHQTSAVLIVEALHKGHVAAAGWVYPGAITRHEGFKADTECGYNAAELIAGLFAIVGAPSFRVGDRPIGAILVLEPRDLRRFAKLRSAFTPETLADTSVSSAGDAAIRGWLTLRMHAAQGVSAIANVSAMALKKLPWADKQKGRFAVVQIEDIDDPMLAKLRSALAALPRLLPTDVMIVEGVTLDDERQGFWLRVSELRGFVTDNIVAGRRWFEGFATARTQDDPPRYLHRFRQRGRNDLGALRPAEAEGVRKMIEAELKPGEARLVEAIHDAMRRRFAVIYNENKTNRDARRNRQTRQRERWRLDVVNAKTAPDLRRAVADLVGRESSNPTLQQSWREVWALLNDASQWELVRDLALVALVSYLPRTREEGAEDDDGAVSQAEPEETAE